MANIFDHMSDENREFSKPVDSNPTGNSGTYKVQFGTESVDVAWREGLNIRDSFTMNADFLGFDADRVLTYRDNENNLLDGHETPKVGSQYMASITHDEKG